MTRPAPSATNDATDYFTGLASLYAGHRPSYPIEAIDWILSGVPAGLWAADIGCGTGISTRLLAARGANVIGIDPNRDMIEQADPPGHDPGHNQASIAYRIGTGESTGLPHAFVDVVVCAQSFHWFDAAAALKEFHRILRGGGRLALMWNVKDDSEPFSAAFCRVAERAQTDAATRGLKVPDEREADPELGGYFRLTDRSVFSNPQRLTLEGVLGRARSASYFPKEGPLLAQLEDELRAMFTLHQRDGTVNLLHRTEVTLAQKIERNQ